MAFVMAAGIPPIPFMAPETVAPAVIMAVVSIIPATFVFPLIVMASMPPPTRTESEGGR